MYNKNLADKAYQWWMCLHSLVHHCTGTSRFSKIFFFIFLTVFLFPPTEICIISVKYPIDEMDNSNNSIASMAERQNVIQYLNVVCTPVTVTSFFFFFFYENNERAGVALFSSSSVGAG